jgi:hypothetical protein
VRDVIETGNDCRAGIDHLAVARLLRVRLIIKPDLLDSGPGNSYLARETVAVRELLPIS